MSNIQDNVAMTEKTNATWLLRTSMIAAAVATSSTAAHAADIDTASAVQDSVAPAVQVTFVSRPVIQALPSTSVVAIATATRSASPSHVMLADGDGKSPPPASELKSGGETKPASRVQGPVSTGAPSGDDSFGVQFRADTLVVSPVLNVGLVESERTASPGQPVTFLGYNNYPAFIKKSELRIFRASQSPDAQPLAVLPVDADGVARGRSRTAGRAPCSMSCASMPRTANSMKPLPRN